MRGRIAFLLCALTAGQLPAASGPTRSTPVRPGNAAAVPPPAAADNVTKPAFVVIGGREYVNAAEALRYLGMSAAPTAGGRRINFSDTAKRSGYLEADSREFFWEGCRTFLGRAVLVHSGQLVLGRRDFETVLLPRCRPDFGRPQAIPRVIVLDPGHGGIDNGTENSPLGLREKNLTLDVARRLQPLLESEGYKVILTRTKDTELKRDKRGDLDRRAEIANRAHADLFVSIHFNAVASDPKVHGTEVFTYAPAGQPSTDSSGHGGDDSSSSAVPADEQQHWSAVLEHALQAELLHVLQTEDRGEKVAHFRVLQSLQCPGVLVEPAIISNAAEGHRAGTERFRQLTAEALALGIRRYALAIAAQPKTTIQASQGTRPVLKTSSP